MRGLQRPCLYRHELFRCRCSDQRPSGVIVDNLRVNVFAGKMDGQARPFRRARDFFPDPLDERAAALLYESSP